MSYRKCLQTKHPKKKKEEKLTHIQNVKLSSDFGETKTEKKENWRFFPDKLLHWRASDTFLPVDINPGGEVAAPPSGAPGTAAVCPFLGSMNAR